MRFTLILGLAVLSMSSAGRAADAEHRHHGPHVHGEATLNIGLDGQLLLIGLEAPGMSLLGFERPPRDDAERASYGHVLDVLQRPDSWLTLPPAAACALDSADVTPHGFRAHGAAAVEQDDAHHEHADFDVTYRFSCHVPLAVRAINVTLIDQFPSLHKINVDLVLPDRQGSQVLVPGSKTVLLTK